MKPNRFVYTFAAVFLLAAVFARPAYAAYIITDEEQFVRKLSEFFNLSVAEVYAFMGVYVATQPTPTPTMTPTPTPTPTPKAVTNLPKHNIETTQGKLGFIKDKFDEAVDNGQMTKGQKDAAMTKIKVMMRTTPSSDAFVSMSKYEQQVAINQWKKEMDSWAKTQGTTLAKLREVTGKGNKFLMGIYID